MKTIKDFQNTSIRTADSPFTKSDATSAKKKIQLNVRGAEDAIRQRVRTEKHARGVRRIPLRRMYKIHQRIADQQYPTANQLAHELEIGTKSIRRDIECMRNDFLLPIEYDAVKGGYFYSTPVDGFPGAPGLTDAEVFSIFLAYKAMEQYRGTPFQAQARLAFKKLSAQLESKDRYSLQDFDQAFSFRPFAPEKIDHKLFETVTAAQRDRRVLEFYYRKPGEKEASLRRVHPYHITCGGNHWFLFAFDEVHGVVRTFAIIRMEKPTLTDDRFTRPHRFDPDEYLGDSFSVMKGEGDYEVVIDFDAFAADVLRGRQWHSSQVITELPTGGCRLRMRLSGLEEVERWILGWGSRATVIGPNELIDRLSATISQLSSRYPTKTRLN